MDDSPAAVLRAAAAGDAAELRLAAVRLAGQVLASPEVRLAYEVLAGGEHADDRAIELAGLLAPSAVHLETETGTES